MRKSGKSAFKAAAAVILAGMLLVGCDSEVNPLAPYEGSRPLIIQRVTVSHAPDISWVGGRAAAIGINRGERPALDSTLVWIHTANGNELDSPIYVRDVIDRDLVASFGGVPTDSLPDSETYTFWVAEETAFEAGLEGGAIDAFTFADTTFQLIYMLRGPRPIRSGGLGITFYVSRDERLLSDHFVVTWEPAIPLRRLAMRVGTAGGFDALIWHILTPEEEEPNLLPPIRPGDEPEGLVIAQEWDGFGTDRYVLWGNNDEWGGTSFSFQTPGYAFYQITHFYAPDTGEE